MYKFDSISSEMTTKITIYVTENIHIYIIYFLENKVIGRYKSISGKI